MTTAVATQKNIFIGNAHLAREDLRAYDAPTDSWLPWTGPSISATVAICTQATDPDTGEVTYTPIAGMGPFNMLSVVAGVFYCIIPTSVVDLLNTPAYLNVLVYQVTLAGPNSELESVQPLLVNPSRLAPN